MPTESSALTLAEALERAYRLALTVETLAGQAEAPAEGIALAVVASELLGVLDHARASMLRPIGADRHTGW